MFEPPTGANAATRAAKQIKDATSEPATLLLLGDGFVAVEHRRRGKNEGGGGAPRASSRSYASYLETVLETWLEETQSKGADVSQSGGGRDRPPPPRN